MKRRVAIARGLNALLALTITGVLTWVYYFQFAWGEKPCPLCILQRLGMIGVAMGALMNLRFGIHPRHYSVSLFAAFFGGAVSIRQILLHICPGSPIFGTPVFGLSFYTWAFLIFCSSVLAIIGLLLLYSPKDNPRYPKKFFEKLVFSIVSFVIIMNLITTFSQCGFGVCEDVPWPQP
jgi:disulfide bond formation protein DsbB